MDELFDQLPLSDEPLPYRMRPHILDEVVGHESVVGPGAPLRALIERGRLPSLILWGPPGCGKTTIALAAAEQVGGRVHRLNAVTASVKDVRRVVNEAKQARKARLSRPVVLFIDEIHRFNRAQQDALLPAVEAGVVRFIGATVHNPFTSVINALLSRSLVLELKPLEPVAVRVLLKRALVDEECGLGGRGLAVDDGFLDHLAAYSGGDARRALQALELAADSTSAKEDGVVRLDEAAARRILDEQQPLHDRAGDYHYDRASAFIKSMRGGDPDAAVYWMLLMLDGGEDPRFIARRIVICASEDVGNADPRALTVAVSAARALEFVGYPEATYNLVQAAVYVACAPKSNSLGEAMRVARKLIAEEPPRPVPPHLRGTAKWSVNSEGEAPAGHYRYPHAFPGAFIPQDYLNGEHPPIYRPHDRGCEAEMAERLAHWWPERWGDAEDDE